MRPAHASLTALTVALTLGLGFAACTDSDAEDYPVIPGASNAVGGAGPGQPTSPGDDDDGFPVDGGTGAGDGGGSVDGGIGSLDGGTADGGIGSFDGGVGVDGDFTPLVDAQ